MNKEKKFKQDPAYRIYRILHLAKKYSWTLKRSDHNKCEFFNKQESIIVIDYHNLKVITTVKHPKWGITTLKREGNITDRIIEMIFRNPRVHIHKNKKIKSFYIDT